jgi:hypothetical protein
LACFTGSAATGRSAGPGILSGPAARPLADAIGHTFIWRSAWPFVTILPAIVLLGRAQGPSVRLSDDRESLSEAAGRQST